METMLVVESVSVSMDGLSDLLNIIIDDFEENGDWKPRRELTSSALLIVKSNLDTLSQKLMGLVEAANESH